MFRAAIFDMDGTLVDSEGFWREAEQEVFGAVGIHITDEMSSVTAPMSTRQVTEHWYSVRPWREPSLEEMESAVIAGVAERMRGQCRPLPGVLEILDRCDALGWRVALASNSPGNLCDLVLQELGIADRFEVVVSADAVEHGKPDPAIYLLAAQRLGVAPADCLAFEDSVVGVRAACAAGMRVVAVSPGLGFPEAGVRPQLVLNGLHEFCERHARELWAARVSRAGT